MCKADEKCFSGRTIEGLTTFFSPVVSDIYTVILLVPNVLLTQETAVFCVLVLHLE